MHFTQLPLFVFNFQLFLFILVLFELIGNSFIIFLRMLNEPLCRLLVGAVDALVELSSF